MCLFLIRFTAQSFLILYKYYIIIFLFFQIIWLRWEDLNLRPIAYGARHESCTHIAFH